MDLESTTQQCRLCLETSDDLVNVFEKFQNSTIASVLIQHFWFQVQENDGMPEWLCQICWIQTKTFHNFYKRIELRHRNYRKSIKVMCADEIKRERSVSPKEEVFESDLNIVKCEEMELPAQLADLCGSDSNDDNSCEQSENAKASDDEDSTEMPRNDDAKSITSKGSRSLALSQSDREAQDVQIREYFNMNCTICSDVSFKTINEAIKHYRQVHKKNGGYLMCCGRKHSDRREVMNHIRCHINPDAYRCDPCGKSFKREASLKNHMDNHQPLSSRAYKCDACTSSFTTAASLKQHIKCRHPSDESETFPCDKCSKTFRQKSSLDIHIKGVHNFSLKHICEICARGFKTNQLLKSHITCAHTTRPEVRCNICGAWLKHELGLRHHIKRHHTSNFEIFKCPTCNKEVRDKTSLGKHIKYAHGEKNHRCTLCDKTFKRAKNLKEHVATHTGEYLYDCAYCEKKFKSSANLYNHRKKVHLAEWTRDCPQRSTSTKVSVIEEIESEVNT